MTYAQLILVLVASVVGSSSAFAVMENRCDPRTGNFSYVACAAQQLNVSLNAIPRQTTGQARVAERFKTIGDLNPRNVRKFVQDHPEHTDYLVDYLVSLDDYYLPIQQQAVLINASLHELLIIQSAVTENSEDEVRAQPEIGSSVDMVFEYDPNIGITPSRLSQRDLGSEMRAEPSIQLSQVESQGGATTDQPSDEEDDKESNERTFNINVSAGVLNYETEETFYVGQQALNKGTESSTQPYVSISSALFFDNSLGLGLRYYDSHQNNLTVPGNPSLGLGDLRVTRDWKGGFAPFVFYNWQPPASDFSGYLEYGQFNESVDYSFSGTNNGVPFETNGHSDFINRTVILGVGYDVFDSWLIRLTHQWSKASLTTRDVHTKGFGFEVQSDF